MADITNMYQQIKVDPEDTSLECSVDMDTGGTHTMLLADNHNICKTEIFMVMEIQVMKIEAE
jgi:hypothetical protein